MGHASNDCPRCEELREEIAYLRSELGIQREADKIQRIRSALPRRHSRGQTAQAIVALYDAKGRPVSKLQLLDAIPPKWDGADERGESIVNVWIWHARKALGFDAVQTVYAHGFALTPVGMERVAALLGETGSAAAA